MNPSPKILLIDQTPDRKERIGALKGRGYVVFPALKMEEARSRCLRGGYDLIIVHAGDEQERALRYCDELRQQCPEQLLLLSSAARVDRDYAVGEDVASLVQAVEGTLGRSEGDYANAA